MSLGDLVELLFPPQCVGCARAGNGLCERCLPDAPGARFRLRTLDIVALGAYEGNLRRAVIALKSGRKDVARGIAQRLCRLVTPDEILVPVPTTPARRRERGFDGCELMASIVAERRGCALLCGLTQISGDRQRGRGRGARLAAHGRFAWRGSCVRNREVTLLDDVVTTGATLEDCAETLRVQGAVVKCAIVAARA